jgi:AcrR family transcriptional regulator
MQAAIGLADEEGLDALTMRALGAKLGFEAMSLYKHVAGKEEILVEILDRVLAEIEIPAGESDWKEAMRRRAKSARIVFTKHSWAIGLLESGRMMGPNSLRYLDATLGSLRSAGFSIEDSAHAFWIIDSYVYGHVIQELSFSQRSAEEATAVPEPRRRETAASDYPHLMEMEEHALTHKYSFDHEFEFGLGLILEGLGRRSHS